MGQKTTKRKNMKGSFHFEKEELLKEHHNHIFKDDGSYSPNQSEKELQSVLQTIIKKDEVINPTENFITNGPKYEDSDIVKLLKRMPKGAHLHLHNIASGSFKKLIKQENLYIWTDLGSNDSSATKFEGTMTFGTFKYFSSESFKNLSEEEKKYWKPINSFSSGEIYNLITMPINFPTKAEKKEHLKNRWTIFQKLWNRLFNIMHAEDLYKGKNSFLYTILEDQFNHGVTYLEFRQTACPLDISQSVYIGGKENNYQQISIVEHVKMFGETVLLFQKEHSSFIGAKLIFCGFKAQSNKEIHSCVETVAHLINNEEVINPGLKSDLHLEKEWKIKDFVAGFDLVGHEDGLRPISDYVKELTFAVSKGIELYLHAGETLSSEEFQLYDAMVLGTKRLGHAYDLINHPKLMDKVKESGVVVECCPLSNNALGYVSDMRNHNARSLLNHGIKVAISSDDPAMFHYDDVSYDFSVVTKSWGLSLMKLKKIAKESFDGTCLTEKEIISAKKSFEKDWQKFVEWGLENFKLVEY
eukprot:maker-scaffold_10-snap-gene-2.4-mRNA-1 protein AED:0.01 eAED:0.01 QI:93/0.75/0.6/1/1/1/5/105/526